MIGGGVRLVDLEGFAAAPLQPAPFQHVIVTRFLREDAFARVCQDFPKIETHGSFPPSELGAGPGFQEFLEELRGPAVRAAFEKKFGVDLSGRPTMVTVRGQARTRDGRIHSDSKTKLISALIYLNAGWQAAGGRLRLLNGPRDLGDFFAEVPPVDGNLVAFRVSPNSWHGHEPATGARRVVQINWLTDASVLRRELARHRLSACLKRMRRSLFGPFASGGSTGY